MKQSKEERLKAVWKKYLAVWNTARKKYDAEKTSTWKEYWAEVARIEKEAI